MKDLIIKDKEVKKTEYLETKDFSKIMKITTRERKQTYQLKCMSKKMISNFKELIYL